MLTTFYLIYHFNFKSETNHMLFHYTVSNSLPFQKARQYCSCEFPQRSRVVVTLVLCADSQITTCVVCAEGQYVTQHGYSSQSAQETDTQFEESNRYLCTQQLLQRLFCVKNSEEASTLQMGQFYHS